MTLTKKASVDLKEKCGIEVSMTEEAKNYHDEVMDE
jgi:hypothetical protein